MICSQVRSSCPACSASKSVLKHSRRSLLDIMRWIPAPQRAIHYSMRLNWLWKGYCFVLTRLSTTRKWGRCWKYLTSLSFHSRASSRRMLELGEVKVVIIASAVISESFESCPSSIDANLCVCVLISIINYHRTTFSSPAAWYWAFVDWACPAPRAQLPLAATLALANVPMKWIDCNDWSWDSCKPQTQRNVRGKFSVALVSSKFV
jgi:hypothetical protein